MGFKPTYTEADYQVWLATVGGGNMTAGSPALGPVGFTPLPGRPSAQYFSPADVGTAIVVVLGAAASGGNLITFIDSYVDTQNVVLHDNAGTTVTDGESNTLVFRPVNHMYGTMEFDDSIASDPQGKFSLKLAGGEYPPVEGQPFLFTSFDPAVGIYEFDAFFGGELDDVTTTDIPGSSTRIAECSCVSYMAILGRRIVQGKLYAGDTLGVVAADIVARGLTLEHVPFTASVAGPALTSYEVDDLSFVSEAIQGALDAANTGTDQFYIYMDPYRRLFQDKRSTSPAPFNVKDTDGSDGNILTDDTGNRTRAKFSNQVYGEAGKVLGDEQTLTGHYPGLVFPQVNIYLPVKVEVKPSLTVNGTPQNIWTSPYDPRSYSGSITIPPGYDWAWAVNSDYLFTYYPAHPGVPPGGNYVVKYRLTAAGRSLYGYTASISERSAIQSGSGLHEEKLKIDNPITPAELEARTETAAKSGGAVAQSVDLKTLRGGLRAGQSIELHLVDINAIGTYVIESYHMLMDTYHPRWEFKATLGNIIGDYKNRLGSALGGGSVSSGGSGFSPGSSSGGTVNDGFVTVTPSSGNVTLDIAAAKNFFLVLTATPPNILNPILTGGSPAAGTTINLIMENPGGYDAPTFDTLFAADPNLSQVSGVADSRTIFSFLFDGIGWMLIRYLEGIKKP